MGKTKYIPTPEALWDLFQKYVEKVKGNPIMKHDFVGGMAKEVNRKLERPLTMEGFECFGWDNNLTVEHYFHNKENAYADYCTICSRIRRIIRNDQIEGGMAGIYNPSITQRLNNLVEKIQEDGTKTIRIIRGDRRKTE